MQNLSGSNQTKSNTTLVVNTKARVAKRLKASDSRSDLAGVRGFKSLPSHFETVSRYGHLLLLPLTLSLTWNSKAPTIAESSFHLIKSEYTRAVVQSSVDLTKATSLSKLTNEVLITLPNDVGFNIFEAQALLGYLFGELRGGHPQHHTRRGWSH